MKKTKPFKVVNFESEEDWFEFRKNKITGSKKIIGAKGGLLADYWQLLVDGLGINEDTEDARERGKRLEPECLERFENDYKKKVDTSLVMWVSKENERIAISPDGFIGDKEAVECKCLNASKHLEIFFTQEIPSEFYYQKLQYFVVNPNLKTLYFCFYNPNIPQKDFFVIKVDRDEIKDEIKFYYDKQVEILKDINNKILLLSNF